MHRTLSLLLFSSLLFTGATAFADATGWEATLGADAVASQLTARDLRYLVAAANGDAADATAALQKALNTSGAAQLVMDASALGKIDGLSDEEIVAKAKNLPVDQIAVVRVFGDGGTTLVVTFYDKEGAAATAFNASLGTPLAAKAGGSKGVAKATSDTVSEVMGEHEETSPAQEEFEKRAVWFQGYQSITTQGGAVVGSANWQEPRQGKYGKALTWGEFYKIVGETELAQQWDEASSWGGTRVLAGMVTLFGIIGVTTFGIFYLVEDNPSDTMTYGLIGSVAGTAGGIVLSVMLPSYPYKEPHEVREMADKYNERLRKELGLSRAMPEPAEEPGLKVAVAPFVSPQFSGLAFTVQF